MAKIHKHKQERLRKQRKKDRSRHSIQTAYEKMPMRNCQHERLAAASIAERDAMQIAFSMAPESDDERDTRLLHMRTLLALGAEPKR